MKEFFPCAVPECEAPAESLGFCHLHYQRVRYTGSVYLRGDPRHGTNPTPVPPPKRVPTRFGTIEEKFWALVDRTHRTDCWEWTGPKIKGYARLNFRWARVLAHRYSWELHHGPIPEGYQVTSPSGCWCVNPDHLTLATASQIAAEREHRARTTEETPR